MGRLRAGGCHLTSLGMSTRIDEGQWTPSHWGGRKLGVHHSRSPQCQVGPVKYHFTLGGGTLGVHHSRSLQCRVGPCEVSLGSVPQSPSQSSFPLSESMWGRYRH